MKIGSGTITGRIASTDTGRVKEYELTLKDISTGAETAGGEVKGRISSPDTGRVGDYTFTLDEVTAEKARTLDDRTNPENLHSFTQSN